MSVTIRLARIGKRNAPAFKIVVANTRDKRNGRFLDVLGHYNPSHNPVLLDINKDKVGQWQEKGAITTDAVKKLMDGTYEFQPYTRQNEPAKEDKKAKKPPQDKEETAKKAEAASEEPSKPKETEQGEPAESPEEQKE